MKLRRPIILQHQNFAKCVKESNRDYLFDEFCLVKIFVEEGCSKWRQKDGTCGNIRAEICKYEKIRIGNIYHLTEFSLSLLVHICRENIFCIQNNVV
jgi:hypothetical protein